MKSWSNIAAANKNKDGFNSYGYFTFKTSQFNHSHWHWGQK